MATIPIGEQIAPQRGQRLDASGSVFAGLRAGDALAVDDLEGEVNACADLAEGERSPDRRRADLVVEQRPLELVDDARAQLDCN